MILTLKQLLKLTEIEEEQEAFSFNAALFVQYKVLISHMRFKCGSWNLLRKSSVAKLS